MQPVVYVQLTRAGIDNRNFVAGLKIAAAPAGRNMKTGGFAVYRSFAAG